VFGGEYQTGGGEGTEEELFGDWAYRRRRRRGGVR